MATTQPPPKDQILSDDQRAQLVHNVSLVGLIACPVLMLLPPRRFNAGSVLMLSCTAVCSNQLTWEYTGRSFVDRIRARAQSLRNLNLGGVQLPEKAKIMQARLREERERREKMQGLYANPVPVEEGGEEGGEKGVLESLREKVDGRGEGKDDGKGIITKVWLGGEGEDWKAKRNQREREALENGRGYGDLIMDQIWEVWNWGKEKIENVRDKDEEVVNTKKEEVLGTKK